MPQPLVRIETLPFGDAAAKQEEVAEETPVALVFNGVSHAVMLATPADLEDFALGFSLTEGLVERPAELLDVEAEAGDDGISLHLTVTAACEARLKRRRRTLAGTTGCGLCGVESLKQVRHAMPAGAAALPCVEVEPAALHRAMRRLADAQPLHARSGGVHAAAWCSLAGEALLVREDVGRHNALDKLVGAMSRARVDAAAGFVAVSSRASFEMVQKTAAAGAGALASVSAPTGLAVRTARGLGLALFGFVREGRATKYA